MSSLVSKAVHSDTNVKAVIIVLQDTQVLGCQGFIRRIRLTPVMVLMSEEKSLDKIKSELLINNKTAFDWRHKILASLSDVDKDYFTGVTESDETFFLDSNKGSKFENCKARKR